MGIPRPWWSGVAPPWLQSGVGAVTLPSSSHRVSTPICVPVGLFLTKFWALPSGVQNSQWSSRKENSIFIEGCREEKPSTESIAVMVSLPGPVWLTAESPERNASVCVCGHF